MSCERIQQQFSLAGSGEVKPVQQSAKPPELTAKKVEGQKENEKAIKLVDQMERDFLKFANPLHSRKSRRGAGSSRRRTITDKNGRKITAPRKRTEDEIKGDFISFFPRIRNANECWVWNGGVSSNGYARFHIKNRYFSSSRLSHEYFIGPLEGKFACHRCDNPICVNPNHLFAGTPQDNSDDMIKKGRRKDTKGINSPRAKITEDDVREIRRLFGTMPRKDIAARFNLPASNITMIAKRINWPHVQ